jgi:hypothetical protein
MPLRQTFATILTLAAFNTHLRAASGTLVDDSIIDPLAHNFATVSFSVPTVHGVTFQQDGVTTHKGWQYATYYQGNLANSTGKVAVARRPLPHGEWQTLVLNDYTFSTNDSHNDVVLGICPVDDSIHLSFDHHGNDLNYRMSVAGAAGNPTTTAWTPALFGPVTDRLLPGGAVMGAVTYPRFIPTPAGKLLFTYRFGGSGVGDEILYEYDGTTRAWSLVGQYTTRSGSYTGTYASGTDRNGYFDNTLFDANGRLHATWCWRETPSAASNHDLLYAYSDDTGRTWKNQLGATIAIAGSSYISVNSPGITGWSIPQSRNYINNSAMTVDKQGRVHVVAWHLPDGFPDQAFSTSLASNSRFIHYWRGTDGIWRKNESNLTGSRAKLSADDDGRLFLIYGNASNIQIAAANPAPDPELDPANSWNDWSPLTLSAALPAGRANTVNIITDTARWEADRIISVYAQETNISGTAPTPLHILDYHVSRAAVLPVPLDGSIDPGLPPHLSWTAGQESVAHDVYFGTSAAAVAAANPSAPEYLGRQSATTRIIGPLVSGTTYYWRVDSIDAANALTAGRVWSFSTASLKPIVTQGTAARTYGGRATFPVTLNLKDPALTTGDLTLYYGESDGGTNPSSWLKSFAFGPRGTGDHVLTLDAVPNAPLFYRFHIATVHGASWAEGSGTLTPVDDLSLWSRSALLDVTGYSGAENLTDFPVLIRLSPASLPGFTYDQMLSPPHGDLRFSTPDGEQILAHEVETWDPLGISHIWVKLPELSPGTKLRIWWGKSGQSPPPNAPTWSAFNGVWHLDEALGFATDSSTNNISASATGVAPATPGIIPGTADLNGTSAAVAINNSAALNPAQISVEAWVKTTSGTGTPAIFNKDQSNGGTNRVWQFRLNAGKPEFIVFNATANANAASPDAVNDNQFHHLCGTWDGTTIRIHVDGVLKGSTAFSGTLRNNQSNKAFIGRGENASPNYLAGSVDEVRLSPVARSADWIRATWENQKPAAAFFTATSPTAPDLDADRLPDAWEMHHFASTSVTDTDPDSDGHANLLEFALGTDPNSGADRPGLALLPGSGGTPREIIYQQLAGGSGAIGTTYTAAGLRYAVELSPDFQTWHSGPSVVAWSNRREPLTDGMERVGVHIADPTLSSAPRVFARIRISPVD